jgi:parvulin-like peptidyl-prolyl isomerase
MMSDNLFRLGILLVLLNWRALGQQDVQFNSINAIVNRTVITRDHVLGVSQREIMAANRITDNDAEFVLRRAKIVEDQLEQMIDRQLIVDEFREKGYRFPDSLIDDLIKARIKQDFGGDRVALTKTLRAQNRTFEEFKREINEDFIVSQMVRQNIQEELIISPKKIVGYYATNLAKFKVGNRVKLQMIVIDRSRHSLDENRQLATKALERLKAGENFATVANELSDDARRFKGGDRGWVDLAGLAESLRSVVLKIPLGEISEVIENQGSRFLVKVVEKQEAGIKPLTEVRQDIEALLKDSERQRLKNHWIAKLRKKAFVRYF